MADAVQRRQRLSPMLALMEIIVWQHGRAPHRGLLSAGGRIFRCALGGAGITGCKREGDQATPAGTFPLRAVLYRADRRPAPVTALPCRPIGLRDGWCDDPAAGAYNRPVRLPFPHGAEHLRRRDRLYDVICVLGHNDAPPVPGAGSAVFLHVARPGLAPTQGCVALAPRDLDWVLAHAMPSSRMRIVMRDARPPVPTPVEEPVEGRSPERASR